MQCVQFLVGFTLPKAEERAALWQHMLPRKAPQAVDIDFLSLGRSFEFTPGMFAIAAEIASCRHRAETQPFADCCWELCSQLKVGGLATLN